VVLKGPITGECYRIYDEEVLVPPLRLGATVVLDNFGSQEGKAVRHAIRAAGVKLCPCPRNRLT
jgi:putative transposase